MEENQRVLDALERLVASLTALDFKRDAPTLSHWRRLDPTVTAAYQYVHEGAALVKATSTKYTLVGKIDVEEGSKLAKDLLRGCELVATGCVVLCNDDAGCARSTRTYMQRAARGVVSATASLIRSFLDTETGSSDERAPKTGAVWSACDAIDKLPKGNRTSLRRDFLLWMRECTDTLEEFQDVLNKGPLLETIKEEESSSKTKQKTDPENTSQWNDLLNGEEDQYTALEWPVAEACVGLVKCSRGSIKLALEACECAGAQVGSQSEQEDAPLYDWIATLSHRARIISDGMTDLGTLLYPPLELLKKDDTECELVQQVNQQHQSLLSLIEYVLDARPAALELTEDIVDLAHKLQTAAPSRLEQAQTAIANYRSATTTETTRST